ncbi:MAG: 16S rRNA (guanine(527)-N(7))-methyltransferase RsmG [Burkholderiaceae bacterium]|nr:16S rRNA (guanine(527)-N(7))-methyltransferase RsmG [Burkholderiaceae bacterium]
MTTGAGKARRRQADGFDTDVLAGTLDRGLAGLGLSLRPDQCARLIGYLSLLVRWNGTYNLTAIRDPREMLVQHLLDSLAVAPMLDGCISPDATCVDVGAGAGLPGIPLAIAWTERRFVLVEPVGKKAAFLRQCVIELPLPNVQVENRRVESMRLTDAPDLILCRAFASLRDFARAIEPIAASGTRVVAMKGTMPVDEMVALEADHRWRVESAQAIEVPGLDAARHLIHLASTLASDGQADSSPNPFRASGA